MTEEDKLDRETNLSGQESETSQPPEAEELTDDDLESVAGGWDGQGGGG